MKNLDFIKWCYTPMYQSTGELSWQLRVLPQYPTYDSFIIINETGKSIHPDGIFLTIEQVYDYWLINYTQQC